MNGFDLLLGHLVGDYIVQNDWMARNKGNAPPDPKLLCYRDFSEDTAYGVGFKAGEYAADAKRLRRSGDLACTVHCLCYTLAVWASTFRWMPWWGLLACFLLHWPMDRWRLAGRWMRNVSGQKAFAEGPLSPWSIVIVDNIGHLLVLRFIAAFAGQ